ILWCLCPRSGRQQAGVCLLRCRNAFLIRTSCCLRFWAQTDTLPCNNLIGHRAPRPRKACPDASSGHASKKSGLPVCQAEMLAHAGTLSIFPLPEDGGPEISMGYVKTAMLMAAMTALFMGVGYLIGGSGGAVIALVVAAAMNAFTWWNSDRMVLRMHKAQPVAPGDHLGLHALTAELARNANLPPPKVYLIDTPQPNAFATGRNPANAAVAVTSGLIHSLTREELAGVIAHELAHIRNHDTA